MRDDARRTHDADGEPHRLLAVSPSRRRMRIADTICIEFGKSHHHDERRHDVEEQVEPEAEPAEQPERPQHREHRRQRRDQHQRDAPEEERGDGGSEQEPETVVGQLVALDRVPDLELHHRRAGELCHEAGALEILLRRLLDAADHGLGRLLGDHGPVERDDDQRQLAVVGQELALDDIVRLQRLEDRA